MTTPCEVLRGVDLKSLSPGSLLDVQTKSRHYRIECLGGDMIRISGHPDHCPYPVSAQVGGSIDEQGVLEVGLIGPGMRFVFLLNDHRSVTTSRVVSVYVDQPEGVQQYPEGLLSGSFPIQY
jgi:hypothetical protein